MAPRGPPAPQGGQGAAGRGAGPTVDPLTLAGREFPTAAALLAWLRHVELHSGSGPRA
ncbi:hypothetical protein [Streptomyces xanthophaeus]|uniref:hypothetical protein n=1 Tax=Streptomyces xanthophaeus TaxID=67385 RepID=UPI00371F1580